MEVATQVPSFVAAAVVVGPRRKAETNAEVHLQVKNAWLTLNKERLLKLARDEALRFFQLGLLHS